MSFTRENRPRTRLVRLDSARWGLAKLSVGILAQSCDAPAAQKIVAVADRLQDYVWS